MAFLTIGMATYNDFDGVYFTLQALRLYQDLADTELLVVDNYGCDHTERFVAGWANARYRRATDVTGTASPREIVFREAHGEAVLCCDSHVLFAPGAIARLKAYYRAHPQTRDLLQGPMLADDLESISTHQEPVWANEMWGIWATDPRGLDPEGEPFEIPMQGLGVFSCRKDVWPGFHPAFRGFGGEEGYIHEKVRQRGGRCLCLPWLRWGHRFPRPRGVPYPVLLHDKVRNYLIGRRELGLGFDDVREHFANRLTDETFAVLDAQAVEALKSPAPPPMVSSGDRGAPDARAAASGTEQAVPARRAIVCYVEDQPHLIQQLLSLRLSWLFSQSPDTDLVVFGPDEVLARLPDNLIKIPQRPAADDPVWQGYRYVNAIACLNGPGAEQLDQYSHLLRTDVDAFLTPAWNRFAPTAFTVGNGGYAHNAEVQQRIRALAAEYSLIHRGLTNVGATWYGPTAVVRRVAAFAELLTQHLLTTDFARDPGAWPGWYRGVALRYASEIAINHCAPDARRSELLDASSTSTEAIERYAHVHCWHTDQRFSKHALMAGKYTRDDALGLDRTIVRDYCLALSLITLEELGLLPDQAA